jgi:UDP-glucose 4-epimerase
MSTKRAIVTGGAGFIGSHLVDLLLENGYKTICIDNLTGGRLENLSHHEKNSSFEFEELDILALPPNSSLFKDVDYVFHLAGIGDIVPSIENPENYMEVNVQGTVKVLEASRFNKCNRFVYAASSSCYGLANTPTDEAHLPNPQYPYALSKFLGEQAVFHWGHVYKLPVNSICIFNAYGPRVKTRGVYGAVFGVFLKQKLAGAPLTVVGDGSQSRDFVFVTDVAESFLAAAQSTIFGERFNIGGGKPQSIAYLAELIGGKKEFIPKRPGEPEVTFANISKANSLLDWYPKISFEEGVQRMISKLSEWDDAPLWDRESIAKSTETWFRYLGKHDN